MLKKIIKIISTCILVAALAASSAIPAVADTVLAVNDDGQGLLQVQAGYLFKDGSFDAWRCTPGFAVNENTIVTSRKALLLDPESDEFKRIASEKTTGYQGNGINLNDYDSYKDNFVYRIYDGSSSLIAATVADTGSESGLLLLNASKSLGSHFVISDEEANFTDEFYVCGYPSDMMDGLHFTTSKDILEQSVTIDSITSEGKIKFLCSVNEAWRGGPLLNDDGEVVGAVTSFSTDKQKGTAFNLASLKSYLDEYGVSYETTSQVGTSNKNIEESEDIENTSASEEEADNEDFTVLDTKATDITLKSSDDADTNTETASEVTSQPVTVRDELEAAIEVAEGVDESRYTDKSVSTLKAAVESAKIIMATENATDDDLKAARTEISNALKAMEEKNGSSIFVNIPMIIGIVAIIAILIFLYFYLQRMKSLEATGKPSGIQHKEKRIIKAKHEPACNSAFNDRYVYKDDEDSSSESMPDSIFDMDLASALKRRNENIDKPSHRIYETNGHAMEELTLETEEQDTSDDKTQLLESPNNAYITRHKTTRNVPMRGDRFVIGRNREKADLVINDNPAISRNHCEIVRVDGRFYIRDLKSANHTYVDGAKIESSVRVELKDGMTFALGDEQFTFHTGEEN